MDTFVKLTDTEENQIHHFYLRYCHCSLCVQCALYKKGGGRMKGKQKIRLFLLTDTCYFKSQQHCYIAI